MHKKVGTCFTTEQRVNFYNFDTDTSAINLFHKTHKAAGWNVLEPDELGPVGQKVERIAEHHGLHVGDDAHLGLVGMDLGLLPDDPGVADGQTVEEVHHDNDDEENEGWKSEG